MNTLTTFFTNCLGLARRVKPRYAVIGGIVLVGVLIGAQAFLRSDAATVDTLSQVPHVQVQTVADLSAASAPLPVTGTVTSLSRATILAQTSGEVVSLSRSLGDSVRAGAVIGSFENSSQQAAVLQAQGAYDAAEAAYEKAENTTAQNSAISSNSAGANAATALTAATNALSSTYSALDDAIHTRADQLFSNPRTSSPTLSITVPDSVLVNSLQSDRMALEDSLGAAAALSGKTTAASVDAHITSMTATAQKSVSFLNDLIKAVNETPPSQNTSAATLSGYQLSLATARTEAVTAITSLTAAKSSYDAAVAGASTAANSATSASGSDLASAAAYVKQAQGTLNAAEAALEKTVIRSPISGTIVSLPVTRGDYVSAFSQVAVVSNPGALYVDAAVTSDDAKTLAVGSSALVGGTTKGVITFIAPALDPLSNKIEVKVGLPDGSAGLTDGSVVALSLSRAVVKQDAAPLSITIPITAVKVLPSGAAVFTVTASSTLQAQPVALGSILGDRIVILSGLTATTSIVTDARGHTDGEAVIVTP